MKKIVINLIKLYQNTPTHAHGTCRFYPTCSSYALEAIDIHGLFKGLWLTFKRILKCHPFGKKGYDPVPPKR